MSYASINWEGVGVDHGFELGQGKDGESGQVSSGSWELGVGSRDSPRGVKERPDTSLDQWHPHPIDRNGASASKPLGIHQACSHWFKASSSGSASAAAICTHTSGSFQLHNPLHHYHKRAYLCLAMRQYKGTRYRYGLPSSCCPRHLHPL